MNGAGNLTHALSALQNSISQTVCLLDYDPSGISSAEKAIASGIIESSDVIFTRAPGLNESEFEDLLCPLRLNRFLKDRYQIELAVLSKSEKQKRFSDRNRIAYEKSGRIWSEEINRNIKNDLDFEMQNCPEEFFAEERLAPLMTLEAIIASKLDVT